MSTVDHAEDLLRKRIGGDVDALRVVVPVVRQGLLDWLAMEFMDRSWSVKDMHRLIVNSATYRQSSRVTPELLEKDPFNRLLARS